MRRTGTKAANDRETRERLREAARTLFSERGFHKVTVREVCDAAKANVAAINYHFGDKLGLYMDLIDEAIVIMRESNRLAEEAGRGLPADERLRAFIHVFLGRLMGAGSKKTWLSQIMAREMDDPTPAMTRVVKEVIEPRMVYLGQAIAEMLDCPTDDPRVKRCFASIQGQVLIYRPHLVREKFLGSFDQHDAEAIAEHIATFSLAGIRALAEQARAEQAHTEQAHTEQAKRKAAPSKRTRRPIKRKDASRT